MKSSQSLLPALFAVAITAYRPPTATIDSGPLIGISTTLPGALEPVNKFLGIPYAAPPQRFLPAKRATAWKMARNASAFGPSCIQFFTDADAGASPELLRDVFSNHQPESEDCLFINAFAPAKEAPLRPVVVFIPGGGWQMSNGNSDFSGFAAYEDIVAFGFNYRTNIFGFPIADEIPLRQRNLGILDQQMALAWVQANAKAFGGDPEKVTIWGESAGAMSVDLHLHNYARSSRRGSAKPPFRAAIMSSGQMSFGLLAYTPPVSYTSGWRRLAAIVGCSHSIGRMACMRRVPAQDLVNNLDNATFSPYPSADGKTVSRGRAAAWRRGDVVRVPMLMSTMAQEGRALLRPNVSIELFRDAWLPQSVVSKDEADAMVEAYRRMPGLKGDFDVSAAMHTDWVWQCPQQMLANASVTLGSPVWRAYINRSVTELLPPKYRYLGKFHGADMMVLFYVAALHDRGFKMPPDLYKFANYFRSVIGKFVRDPRAGPGWPAIGSPSAPRDLAVLGDRNGGALMVNRDVLDANCAIFTESLAAAEKASVAW
ncbi:hypothetical protein XA68_13258 [Ophiocordyceps unilateralis]|uniref:Carboxylic ester hydrolase n=1 Tax=Ophiocordyceps unilateralis TaxID=268505 RepID=A0A2A9PMC6_OPHUN|nr:hypothetical protein XA68_13258 [Ophiocordyceps unilateralis]